MRPEEIIIAPVVTEKSNDELQEGKYTFKVNKKATKVEIAKAVEKLFDVLLNIDFNKIHLEEENVFKDVAYSRMAMGFGMEIQAIFDDYLKYMESGKVKDMAYDKEKLALVRGNFPRMHTRTEVIPFAAF